MLLDTNPGLRDVELYLAEEPAMEEESRDVTSMRLFFLGEISMMSLSVSPVV